MLSARSRQCYNNRMTEQLNEAIEIIRELPDDEQDTIARQLMRLLDLSQASNEEPKQFSGGAGC
jgi:ABC-type polar amino acid transport system ATPase subunit